MVEKLSESTNSFAQADYVVLRKLVPESVRSFLYEYVLKSAQTGRLRLGDSAVPDTPNFYSDPFMDTLLDLLLPRMEAESGVKLFPTYSYFRVYRHGDVLRRHHDRPSCEISASLNLGYVANEPWPIWIEIGGMAKCISLKEGDAMIYRGIKIPHWRENFPGEHSAQVFLHYVDQNGPYKGMIYDGRKGLSKSPTISGLMHQLMSATVG